MSAVSKTGQFLKEAQLCEQKIEYYYKQAGADGYGQALFYWNKLDQLIFRAYKSKNDKEDVIAIQAIKERVEPMMNDMKRGSSEQANE